MTVRVTEGARRERHVSQLRRWCARALPSLNLKKRETAASKESSIPQPGVSGFAIGLVNSVMNLPDGQVKFFEEFKLQKNCEINLLIKTFLGLGEMMFGLVDVSFSLPEWQSVKNNYFLCTLDCSQSIGRLCKTQPFSFLPRCLMIMHEVKW